MNVNKKNNNKIISCITVFMFLLTQIFLLAIPVKAQIIAKAPITLTKTADKSQARVGDEITLNYTIQPNDVSVSASDAPDKEIVMVMDTSGSMNQSLGSSSRLSVAKAAAKRFVDKFSTDSNTKIGLIQYSNIASKKSNGLVSNTSFDTIKNSIDGFQPDGGTNTGDGLRLAYYMLTQSTNTNAKKYIVLFTDGEPTFYSYTSRIWSNSAGKYVYNYYTDSQEGSGYSINSSNDSTNGLAYADKIAAIIPANSNINSFMIGCTMSDYGENTLQEISEKAEGTCSFVQTAADIDTVYDQLANKIQSELPVNSIKFQETLPVGMQIQEVPAGFTVSGQTITGDLGNITYKYSSSTNKYSSSSINFQIKVKAIQDGTYSLSKDTNGGSNSFITYKDIDNADGKLLFPVNDISVTNVTASIKLGKTVDKPNVTANQPFNLTYTIQPDKIPVEDVDPSYQKGSDIVLVLDNSGSMDESLSNSNGKTKMQVVKDTATDFINKFKGDSNINIAIVKFSTKANVVSLDGSSLNFGNLANSTQYNCLINKVNDSSIFNTDGGTNIGDGLRTAYWLLKNQGNTGRKKYVILLTDGVPTVSTVKDNSNLVYNQGSRSYYTGWIYDRNAQFDYYFKSISKYDYSTDNINSSVKYVVNPGDNDYNQLALNYAYNISDIMKSDTDLNIKPIMIAFSNGADPSKLSQIAGRAGGEYKVALSQSDMSSVYDGIAGQIQSDFTITGVQFEETLPQGISLQQAVLPTGFIVSGQKITGVLSSISYKLDSTGKYYEPLPVTGFTIEKLWGSVGANNTAAQYVLGSNQTSFISYKDINGSITKNPFPEATINVFPNSPADISATLVPKTGQADVYTLTITSNTNSPNTIKSFNIGGTEKAVDLWTDTTGLLNLNSSKSHDLNQSVLIGNTSLCVNAKDKDNNTVNETVPLISVSNVELKDIEQNNKVRPGDITFATEPNATITSLKVNGEIIATNQNTGTGIYKCLGVNLKDGDNVIEVNLTNKFNNTSNMVLHQAIDATAPTITANYTYSNKKIDATFSENVNLVWLECDLNNDGKISSDEKVTVSTDTKNQLKDIQVPDNFIRKNIVIKARDLSGNIGSGVPVDKNPPQVQPVYTDNTYKIIDVTVDELVNSIWLECDVNKDGSISSNEKVVISNTIGTEVRGVQIPDAFYGKDITVWATDLAGNSGSEVLLKPLLPPIIETPTDGTKTSNTKPTISGTGVAGATVTVYDGETLIGTAVVGSDGKWSLIPETALANGDHVLTAMQSDEAGNVSDKSGAVNLKIVPGAPEITSPVNGTKTSDNTPTISGTGIAGLTVTVYDGETLIGTAVVGSDGKWSLIPETALANGDHVLTAMQSDEAGNVSDKSGAVNLKIVPGAPEITSPVNGTKTSDNTPTISGTGIAGLTVTVYDGETSIGTAVVGSDGKWSLTPSSDLARGAHVLTATQKDAAGNESDKSNIVNLTIVPAAPVITSPENGMRTSDNTPVISGTGIAGLTVTVYDGTTVIGTAVVGSDGKWSLTPGTALTNEAHAITATQRDGAGNVSDKSNTVNLTIDTTSVVKKGIFLNGKLLDVDINIVRSLNVDIGIGIKTVFNGQDVKLQINKDNNNINIVNNAFDLYEVTDENSFTLNKINTTPITGTVVTSGNGQEFTIPMDTKTVSTGYKYYLLVFKMKVNRNASLGKVTDNTIKINSQQPLSLEVDSNGHKKPFTFDFNIVDLPPLK
ncbi:Ig-like domain-containing protein [Clostridium magnum]|uniref:Ig-like domain-containing protein n=1 Tax=Clostridium magnum TaxID=33954 RepID=UPI0009152F4A|nr:Ig-like domain-containing protein [Clostridium magnum]SHI15788.1 Ig-like domain (group 3) [Clostridium magnum DSM 2767]